MADVSVAACLWHASQVSATLHCHTGALPFAGQIIAACSSHDTNTLASEYLTVKDSMSGSKSALHYNSPYQALAASFEHKS